MQAKNFDFGPVALTTTLTTNILNCAITSLAGPVGFTATQPLIKLNRVRIVNKTGTAATFTLYKGVTAGNAAGTEFIGTAISVPANSGVDYYGPWYFDSTDFLVGGAGTTTALTIEGSGEITFA